MSGTVTIRQMYSRQSKRRFADAGRRGERFLCLYIRCDFPLVSFESPEIATSLSSQKPLPNPGRNKTHIDIYRDKPICRPRYEEPHGLPLLRESVFIDSFGTLMFENRPYVYNPRDRRGRTHFNKLNVE